MSCHDEVLKIRKKLDKMVSTDTSDHEAALDMLNTLKKQPMNLDVLQKTRIGMTVNSLRKATKNEDVITLSKALIKNWKKLLSDNSSQSKDSQSAGSLSRSSSVSSTREAEASQDSPKDGQDGSNSDDNKSGATSPPALPRQLSFPAKASDTSDTIRLKCREMIANALKTSGVPENSADPGDVGAAIEECIFKEFGSTEMKYKNRIRSRVANLKDAKNPTLRENVLLGRITPDRMAVMTADEMANDEMKKIREKFTKEAINDHQMATTGGTKTDLLKCNKCGKRNVTYNQVQTRSADEPMTTFCFCNECGNRWKFC